MGIVRIPLDYYRILGLPTQATTEQLQQAHRDRIQQLPRREFSDVAIAARRQLIDQAYTLLSDPASRQEYDTSFLAKSYDLMEMGRNEVEAAQEALGRDGFDPELEIDPYTPSIEVENDQLVGALLLLLELGEYELVLRLGRPYLSNSFQILREGEFGDLQTVSADIVLTIALAYLELGREQWQQGQYENAAASLEHGQELLLREGIFANIRGEMQSDLFKLRPYRILELVSLPDGQEEARRQGISLLEDMLHDRSGIDGSGDDLSGLGVDDFLRFIQQLRGYLTATEQQVLFEAEARRPSAVAVYLAVYALMARGFAQRQPALIRRAKMMLLRLGSQQDVHLEQAVCSLLLGQTDEASRALELSQEFESLAFIRDHSQGSPDLLPGLCLYSERWFQNEVFPHFRDLQNKQASLTEYFADEDVQLYLEELPSDSATAPTWTATATASQAPRRTVHLPTDDRMRTTAQDVPATYPVRGTATIDPPSYGGTESTPGSATTANPPMTVAVQTAEPAARGRGATPPADSGRSTANNGARPTSSGSRSLSYANLRLDRIMLLAALGLLGIMLLGFLFGRLLNRPQVQTAGSNTSSSVDRSSSNGQVVPVEVGFANALISRSQSMVASAPLTEENAPEIVRTWLTAKAAAMGENHEVDQLETILVDPVLSEQRVRAEDAKTSGIYWQYEHDQIEVVSVESSEDSTPDQVDDQVDDQSEAEESENSDEQATNSESPNRDRSDSSSLATPADGETASIEAIVREKADLYSDGQLDPASSYDSSVRVRYDLVRQQGKWHIQGMEVLE
jgi:curved DNA-binding protein CbpA